MKTLTMTALNLDSSGQSPVSYINLLIKKRNSPVEKTKRDDSSQPYLTPFTFCLLLVSGIRQDVGFFGPWRAFYELNFRLNNPDSRISPTPDHKRAKYLMHDIGYPEFLEKALKHYDIHFVDENGKPLGLDVPQFSLSDNRPSSLYLFNVPFDAYPIVQNESDNKGSLGYIEGMSAADANLKYEGITLKEALLVDMCMKGLSLTGVIPATGSLICSGTYIKGEGCNKVPLIQRQPKKRNKRNSSENVKEKIIISFVEETYCNDAAIIVPVSYM